MIARGHLSISPVSPPGTAPARGGVRGPRVHRSDIRTVLVVDEDNERAGRLQGMFRDPRDGDIRTARASSIIEAEARLAAGDYDAILLNPTLPDAQGLASIRRINIAAPRIPVLVVGPDDESLAAEALQEGAQDYLIESEVESRTLLRTMRRSVERKIVEVDLFAEKERAQETLNCIGDAVACTDAAGNISFLNVVAERLAGWRWQDAAGRPMAEVLQIVDAASRKPIPDPMAKASDQDRSGILPSNSVLVRRDGSEVPIEDSVAPIHDRDGNPRGAVIVFRDVSANRALVEQIAHSAEHDFLTGLPNRMLFNDRVHQAITVAPRHDKKVAILFVDLDRFKRINDSLGHPVGDQLLQSIAKRLVECVRQADTVSRQGGDEFVILLSEVEQREDAALTAGRMLEAAAGTHSIGEYDLHITASIGISVYPDDGREVDTLVRNADAAMYQAKDRGRNTAVFYDPSMIAPPV